MITGIEKSAGYLDDVGTSRQEYPTIEDVIRTSGSV